MDLFSEFGASAGGGSSSNIHPAEQVAFEGAEEEEEQQLLPAHVLVRHRDYPREQIMAMADPAYLKLDAAKRQASWSLFSIVCEKKTTGIVSDAFYEHVHGSKNELKLVKDWL